MGEMIGQWEKNNGNLGEFVLPHCVITFFTLAFFA